MPPLLQSNCRKRNRISGFDYSQNNYYFVTINTDESKYYLGRIVGGKMILNKYGKIVEKCILDLPNHYSRCEIDVFIVMPNHVHIIVVIDAFSVGEGLSTLPMGRVEKPAPTKIYSLSEIVRGLKTFSSMKIHQSGFTSFSWQRSFWDHVIRDECDLEIKQRYILNNPLKWHLDKNNFESKVPMKKRGEW